MVCARMPSGVTAPGAQVRSVTAMPRPSTKNYTPVSGRRQSLAGKQWPQFGAERGALWGPQARLHVLPEMNQVRRRQADDLAFNIPLTELYSVFGVSLACEA